MSQIIQPRILKGFRDFLPEQEIPRALLLEKLTAVFRNSGFVPIDTPALEYAEILLRKSGGETEKQVFRFTDNGGRDIALRFDLTVPFARFVAEHKNELYFPFKRYHMAKVWRGEKPQAGRYREFMQCDFDIIGADSAGSDFEILSLIRNAFDAIAVSGITIRISHRGIFNRLLARLGLSGKSEDILRLADKAAKISGTDFVSQMHALTESADKAEAVLHYIRLSESAKEQGFERTLDEMEAAAGGPAADTERLREIYACMQAEGIEDTFCLDPSITRGLDYYTGIVYETFLNGLPEIGSVCSGGRYDNLAGLYMKEEISGVGASIGLDRLIAALEKLQPGSAAKGFTQALVFWQENSRTEDRYRLAAEIRKYGVACEVFPDQKKPGIQYAWAERKGIRWGLFPDGNGQCTLKNLFSRENTEGLSAEEAAEKIRAAGPGNAQ